MPDQEAVMPFSLDRVPAITQAEGALDRVGALAATLGGGAAVLLVADPGLAFYGITPRAEASLRGAGLRVSVYTDIKSDPAAAQVDAAADIARAQQAGVVVALGGGSAMDAGKAVAAIAGAPHAAEHYALASVPLPERSLRKICVPTTAGTGSETTRTAVLSDATGAKVWLWGDAIKPDAVLLDPTLTVDLPPHLTAATGIDALVHAIEASTNARATAANDLYCHEAIRLVMRHLPRATASPADLQARAALQWAAALAGIGIDNAGTAVAHTIGHALASLRPIHHGRAVGVAMLASLAWNAERDPDGKFAAVAEAMGEPRDASRVAPAFERLLRRLGIKVSLMGEGHDDLRADRLATQMARPENAAMRNSNRRPVEEADLMRFAATVLEQE
jgi:alcohol dehydrogenase class IV